ncbi:MAG: butyrate kinase [Bacteroidales bacterium]|jgi:butyrate kinase|nr:butyrate kinase [Bacteroidales bacterium]
MDNRLILAINPGSTSTKFALFRGEQQLFEKTLRHSTSDLEGFSRITDQLPFRHELVMKALEEEKATLSEIVAVVGRGGLVNPIESGIYEVNDLMKKHLLEAIHGEHASNLGALIADMIASALPVARAYIVDPVVVDELEPVARLSGHPLFERRSIFHALNQKAVARIYASSAGRDYEDMNLVIAHMGGGISVGAHRKGRVVDVNNALNGDGPYSPERSGGLPAGQIAELCFSGKYTLPEVKAMFTGKGGMVAYLGTNSFKEVYDRAAAGDQKALLISLGCSYQIAKEIGAMVAVLSGEVDAIILTGGLAYEQKFVDRIEAMVGKFAPVFVYPGEDELKALAFNGLLAVAGRITVKEYKG